MPMLSISYNNITPPIRERGRELQFCLQLVLNISEKTCKHLSCYIYMFLLFSCLKLNTACNQGFIKANFLPVKCMHTPPPKKKNCKN